MEDINELSEAEQIELVSNQPRRPSDGYHIGSYYFGEIKNPSEAVQIAAVTERVVALNFIDRPSEKVQLAAVNADPRAFKLIRYPTKKVQFIAVKANPFDISLINRPSLRLLRLAAMLNGAAVMYRRRYVPPIITAILCSAIGSKQTIGKMAPALHWYDL
ncbi:hypothetical protein WEU32_06795 [Brevundimonas sp. BH3]|uniref:hypothetical protein n=1 Tax=Brevundimonas sp. BH3 TaxID=3133089 RepID=UPI003254575A